jgi:hypothetical protein
MLSSLSLILDCRSDDSPRVTAISKHTVFVHIMEGANSRLNGICQQRTCLQGSGVLAAYTLYSLASSIALCLTAPHSIPKDIFLADLPTDA